MNVYCSTCGQDLPEPQRRLAEAELSRRAMLKTEDEAREEALSAWMRRENALLDREQTRLDVSKRRDRHDVDGVWELRRYEEPSRNLVRMAEFKPRAKLFGLTVPMKRPPISEWPSISDGALGTFHHPV